MLLPNDYGYYGAVDNVFTDPSMDTYDPVPAHQSMVAAAIPDYVRGTEYACLCASVPG